MKRAVKKRQIISPQAFIQKPPEAISPNEFVPFYAVVVALPSIPALPPPAAHQIGTDKDISFALVTGDIMTPADIEQPRFVTKPASNIGKKVANNKVTCPYHANHSLSRSMIRPFLI
jgi:hypothetical protein